MKSRSRAGRSAYGAASVRAMEIFVPPSQRLFEDEIVLALLPALPRFLLHRAAMRAAFTTLFEASAPGIQGALLCRTRRIDDAIGDGVRRGLSAVVLLGAGRDTRPYRLPVLAGSNVLEIDLPQVQGFKKGRLSRLRMLPPNVHFVSTDFDSDELDNVLARGGLSTSEPAIFVWEGVSQYLKPDSVDSVLRTIANRPSGTELIFTYLLEEAITGAIRLGRSEAFRKSAKRRPEPWYFGIDPPQLKAFLDARGLTLRDDFGAQEHQADYLRPLKRRLEVSEIERVAIATV